MDPFSIACIHTAIEAPFVCFHLSVMACIIRQIRLNDTAFSSGFFAMYLLQSAGDHLLLFMVRLDTDERVARSDLERIWQ